MSRQEIIKNENYFPRLSECSLPLFAEKMGGGEFFTPGKFQKENNFLLLREATEPSLKFSIERAGEKMCHQIGTYLPVPTYVTILQLLYL